MPCILKSCKVPYVHGRKAALTHTQLLPLRNLLCDDTIKFVGSNIKYDL